MSSTRELRPVPRRLVAVAIATAIVATGFARAERLRSHDTHAVEVVGAAGAALVSPLAPPVDALWADVPASGNLTATLYDPAGARVRVLVDGAPAARGATRLAWDGRDEAGRTAPAGAYALKLEVRGKHVRALRVARVRWPASPPGA